MSFWANIMVAVAIAIFLAILAFMARTWSPCLARNVKYAERAALSLHDFKHVQQSHPEIVKVARQDRYPFFVLIHLMVTGYVLSILTGAPLTSNVASLGDEARYTMASCFLVGSALVLAGVVSGGQVGGRTIMPSVADHPTASVLGDDIVFPYRIEMAGMSAMMVSSGIYSWTSFNTTTGSLGGWLTGGIAVACALTIDQFYRSVEAFQKWDHILISEAKARIDKAGDARDAHGSNTHDAG